jgi:YVTN family beta-propeller protein
MLFESSTLFQNPILLILSLLGFVILVSVMLSTTGSVIKGAPIVDSSNISAPQIYHINPGAGIIVSTFPVGIAVNPNTNMIYVTNEFSNTLSVINGRTDDIETATPILSTPYDVDVDPYSGKVYVANLGSDSISILDGATKDIIATVENVTSPVGLDVDPDGTWIYVTNIDTNTVSKIDGVTNKIVKNVTVGKNPYSVDISGETGYRLYVTNTGSDEVSVIDGHSFKLLTTIPVADFPVGLAANPKTNLVYVANRGSNVVSVIDGSSNLVIKKIPVGKNPDGIDINFNTNVIYVTNTGSNTVSVISGSTNNVIATIPVNNNISPELQAQEGPLPPSVQFPNIASFVDVNRGTNMIYVTNPGSNTVSVINGSTNKLLVGLTFNIDPPNSGRIGCISKEDKRDTYTFNTNKYVRFPYGKKLVCTSYSNNDYRFNFWSGDIPLNSTFSESTGNILHSIADWFQGIVVRKSDPLPITATQSNQVFKANFKDSPDYIGAVILPIMIAVLTFVIHRFTQKYRNRRNKRKEENYLLRHHKIIEDAYSSSIGDKRESYQRLTQMRNDIIHDYAHGAINEKNYEELLNKISTYLLKITRY